MDTIMPRTITHNGTIYYHSDYGTFQSKRASASDYPLTEDYLPILTHEGYIFLGWYYEDNFITLAKVGDMLSGEDLNLYAKWATDGNKYLDAEGVKYLWSKINMNDYPNNELLMSVIQAIDETKADKSELFSGSWNDLEDKPDIAVKKGIGVDSTCLHTGPIDAASKYQVVAGKYNQLDGGYSKETSSTFWYPAVGGAQEQFTIITEPIFDSVKGNFKAQVTGKATGLAVGDFFLRADQNNYEVGQELTLTQYYKCTKFGSSISATIYKIKDNTDTIGKYAVIVGNGNSENDRSNAYALDWDGNSYYSGEVYVGENKEQLARLNKVPHYYEEENFSTNGLVNFVVKNSSYLEYETEKYLSGTEPYKDTMPDSLYRVIIDNETYEIVTNQYGALQTVSSTSELVNKGDFIISNRMLMYSTGESYAYKVIQLPNLDGEQHSVEVIYLNKLMVPEEIIPDTIVRNESLNNYYNKFEIDNLELISIDDIDKICNPPTSGGDDGSDGPPSHNDGSND